MSQVSSQPLRNHLLARVGLNARPGSMPDAVGALPASERSQARSTFVDALPQYAIERAGFHVLPAPQNVTFGDGEEAWYGLRRINTETFGQEFTLKGAAATLLPADVDGGALAGYLDPMAWGDTRGLSTAIVIGRNLPIVPGGWTASRAFIPGIEAGQLAGHAEHTKVLPHTSRLPEYIIVQSFPTGKYRDTAPNKPPYRWSMAPDVMRFVGNDNLDVALVVRGSQLSDLDGNENLIGYADIALTIGLSISERNFSGKF